MSLLSTPHLIGIKGLSRADIVPVYHLNLLRKDYLPTLLISLHRHHQSAKVKH